MINVKVINASPTLKLPEYKTEGSSGLDLMAAFDVIPRNPSDRFITKYYTSNGEPKVEVFKNLTVDSVFVLEPGARACIPVGLYMEIQAGYELQIRSRSGLALRNGIIVVNAPGTIDCDYRGMVGVELINEGFEDFHITHGMRIAQGVFAKFEQARFYLTEELSETGRGTNGYGSSGLKG